VKKRNKPPVIKKTPQNQPNDSVKTITGIKIPKNTTPSEIKENNTQCNKHSEFKIWCKHNGIQSILALATIGTLITYIVVSCHQNRLTRESLNMNDSVNKMDLRAYIGVKDFKFYTDTPGVLWFSVDGSNTGKTPVYKMYGIGKCIFDGRVIVDKDMTDLTKDTTTVYPSMRGNGVDFTLNFKSNKPFVPDGNGIIKIVKSGKVVYFFGCIFYNDVFKRKHTTTFCYSVSNDGDEIKTIPYKRYNDGN